MGLPGYNWARFKVWNSICSALDLLGAGGRVRQKRRANPDRELGKEEWRQKPDNWHSMFVAGGFIYHFYELRELTRFPGIQIWFELYRRIRWRLTRFYIEYIKYDYGAILDILHKLFPVPAGTEKVKLLYSTWVIYGVLKNHCPEMFSQIKGLIYIYRPIYVCVCVMHLTVCRQWVIKLLNGTGV